MVKTLDDHIFGPFTINNGCCICQRLFYGHDTRFFCAVISPLFAQHPMVYTSSTRTRRGGSCLKDIYKTFLIYRTCMRRAPAKPVRACTLRKWCPVSHVTFEAPLRTSHFSPHSSHSSHSTLHTARFPLHTPHFTLHTPHFTLHSPHFTLHTPHFLLHTPHFTLHTPHFTLHTPNFTLHSSRPTLHTALFTPHTSSHLSSSHLIPTELFSSHLFSYVI